MNKFQKVLEPIADLLAKKNADYGDSYKHLRDEYGPVAFYIRLADKISRLKQVDAKGCMVTGETSMDTLRDLIGYSVLELVYRQEQPPKTPAFITQTIPPPNWGGSSGQCPPLEYYQQAVIN